MGCEFNIYMEGEVGEPIYMNIHRYIRSDSPIKITKARKYSPKKLAVDRERYEYSSRSSTAIPGRDILPQACIRYSKIQQKLWIFKVEHLMDAK